MSDTRYSHVEDLDRVYGKMDSLNDKIDELDEKINNGFARVYKVLNRKVSWIAMSAILGVFSGIVGYKILRYDYSIDKLIETTQNIATNTAVMAEKLGLPSKSTNKEK